MFQKTDEIIVREELGSIRKMKSGVDGVKVEYLKSGGEVCAEWMMMVNLCLSIECAK